MTQSKKPHYSIKVPQEVQAGVPVDFAGVWRTNETLVLDFSVQTEPTRPDADGNPVLNAMTVARVRVPVAQGFSSCARSTPSSRPGSASTLTASTRRSGQRPTTPYAVAATPARPRPR